jgi:protoporphyrinogen oxidase
MSKKIAVLGGGPMGLSVAFELLKSGFDVDLYEKDGVLGGMSAHFDFSGLDIEMYYHFVCGPDDYTFNLMKELGVFDRLKWTDTKMGFFYNGGLYKWGGPFELLFFPKAGIIEKARYGLHIFSASRRKKWESLDNITALDWIRKWEGEKGYKKFWDSLFELKFYELKESIAAPWLWSRLARVGKSRKNLFQERMGYIDGGSVVIIDALEAEILGRGGSIFVNSPVEEIRFEDSHVTGITVGGIFKPYDKVVSTIPIQYVRDIAPGLPVSDLEKLEKLDNVGVVCVIMKLKESLTSNFWLNVTDERMDIPGMIELSNLNTGLPDNVVYIPFYMHKSHPKFSEPLENFIDKAKEYVRLVNPNMTADKVLDIRVFRYEYAQPVATVGFLSKLPPIASDERKGFFFADTAFCYPEDRSINESVKVAYEIVRLIRNS